MIQWYSPDTQWSHLFCIVFPSTPWASPLHFVVRTKVLLLQETPKRLTGCRTPFGTHHKSHGVLCSAICYQVKLIVPYCSYVYAQVQTQCLGSWLHLADEPNSESHPQGWGPASCVSQIECPLPEKRTKNNEKNVFEVCYLFVSRAILWLSGVLFGGKKLKSVTICIDVRLTQHALQRSQDQNWMCEDQAQIGHLAWVFQTF